MEDGKFLSEEDKKKMISLKDELAALKTQHKNFAKNKGKLSSSEREDWRKNSQRTNEIYVEIKELRHKNIVEAGKSPL
jgi:hypothetical protein